MSKAISTSNGRCDVNPHQRGTEGEWLAIGLHASMIRAGSMLAAALMPSGALLTVKEIKA